MPSVVGLQIFSVSSIFKKTAKTHLYSRPFYSKSNFCSPVASVAPKLSTTSISQPMQGNKKSFAFLVTTCTPNHFIERAIFVVLLLVLLLRCRLHQFLSQCKGFNGGEPITEEFFIKNVSGMHNDELCHMLFPDWDFHRAMKFMEDKEAMFRRLASEQLKPVCGLGKLCRWIEDRGLKRAAVTNAPRPNAELIISMLSLSDFFELLIIGSECDRAKPFPDPYLKALEALGVSPEHAFVFEDSKSGTKSGVAAGMPVLGLATRNPEELLTEAGATFVIKDFEDSKLWAALEEREPKSQPIHVTT